MTHNNVLNQMGGGVMGDMWTLTLAIILMIGGSVGINYYNRLVAMAKCKKDDCTEKDPTDDEFGRIWTIVLLVVGILAVVGLIGKWIFMATPAGRVASRANRYR